MNQGLRAGLAAHSTTPSLPTHGGRPRRISSSRRQQFAGQELELFHLLVQLLALGGKLGVSQLLQVLMQFLQSARFVVSRFADDITTTSHREIAASAARVQ